MKIIKEISDILRSKESDNVKISILSDIIRNRTCSECGKQLISSDGMPLDHVNYFPDTDTIACGSCIPRKKVYCIDCFYFSNKSHNPYNIDESKCSAVAEKIVPESWLRPEHTESYFIHIEKRLSDINGNNDCNHYKEKNKLYNV